MSTLQKRELVTELIGIDVSEWSDAAVESELFQQMEDKEHI